MRKPVNSSYSIEVRNTEFYNVLRIFVMINKYHSVYIINPNTVTECLHQNPNKSNENPEYVDSHA